MIIPINWQISFLWRTRIINLVKSSVACKSPVFTNYPRTHTYLKEKVLLQEPARGVLPTVGVREEGRGDEERVHQSRPAMGREEVPSSDQGTPPYQTSPAASPGRDLGPETGAPTPPEETCDPWLVYLHPPARTELPLPQREPGTRDGGYPLPRRELGPVTTVPSSPGLDWGIPSSFPLCEQTDRHLWKHYRPVVLRTRVVINRDSSIRTDVLLQKKKQFLIPKFNIHWVFWK